jgi:hypothetical protein
MLCGFLFGGFNPPLVAADDCRERIRKAEEKVKKETERHGERSKQAEQARRNLEKERSSCNPNERDREHPSG